MRRKGSMTIEAALVLPLFLTAILLFAGMLQLLRIHDAVGRGLRDTGEKIALYTGPAVLLAQEFEIPAELEPCGQILTLGYAEGQLRASLSEQPLIKQAVLENGSLSLLGSKFLEDKQTIDLVVNYEVRLPFSAGFLPRLSFSQRAKVHGWVGYQDPAEDSDEKDDEIVYITPSGTCWHKSASCTYLKPSVMQTDGSSIADMRNHGGGKYYPCEFCHPPADPAGAVCYLTDDGTKYHTDPECRGIYHEIRAVPLSEVGSRRPCSKCGN